MAIGYLLYSFRSVVRKLGLAVVSLNGVPLFWPKAAGGAALDVAVPELEVAQQRPPVGGGVLAKVALMVGVGRADVAEDHLLAGGQHAALDAHPGAVTKATHLQQGLLYLKSFLGEILLSDRKVPQIEDSMAVQGYVGTEKIVGRGKQKNVTGWGVKIWLQGGGQL